MRAAAGLVLGILMLCGCGFGQPGSGLTGQVVASPTCPVQRIGHPCPPKPVAVRLRAVAIGSGGGSVRFASDRQGGFRVALPPGTYRIENVGGVFPRCDARETVPARAFRKIVLHCDTGIR